MAPQTAEGLAAAVERDDIEFLFAMFVDLHGKPCARLVPVSAIEQMLAGRGIRGAPWRVSWVSPDEIRVLRLDVTQMSRG